MNEQELIQKTRRLIGRWDNVRIVGQGWAGDVRRGFEFNPIPTRSGKEAPPPPEECYVAPSVAVNSVQLNTDCYPNGFCEPGCIAAFNLTDIGLNSTFPTAFFIGKLCDTCVYFFRPTVIHFDSYHCEDPCDAGSGCDGDICGSGDLQVNLIISRIGLTWYCWIGIIGASPCPSGNCTDYPFVVMDLFYDEQPYSGVPTDPVTFTNQNTIYTTNCIADIRSNVFFDTIAACCAAGCGDINIFVAGKNGTITFTP